MSIEVDDDFLYAINSLRRIDVLYTLESLTFARNCEIADILCITPSRASTLTHDLQDHGLVEAIRSKHYKVYCLSERGKIVVNKIRDYHGTN